MYDDFRGVNTMTDFKLWTSRQPDLTKFLKTKQSALASQYKLVSVITVHHAHQILGLAFKANQITLHSLSFPE